MGWVAPLVSVAAAQQASAKGKYNQTVEERNAVILEQESDQIEKQNEFDLARFDQKFTQLQGETTVKILKSGAELSGSGLRIKRYNAEQAEIEKDILDYNSKVAQSKKLEEANFARIKGTMARQSARLAQIGTIASTGTSLLRMKGTI